MKPGDIFSSDGLAQLKMFLDDGPLLAFDFDGVLAPIVPVRDAAHLRPTSRDLLSEVARRFPCIVVSGRALSNLAPRLYGIPLRMVFGNFGYEPVSEGTAPPPVVAEWVAALHARLPGDQGLFIEDKKFSVAVHYRHARDPELAQQLIADAVGELRDVRVLDGTKAVTLLPSTGPHKGSTVLAACERLGCQRLVYVGDDGTDEDAFECAPPDRLLSIRVGAAARTSARFTLARQSDLDRLLETIIRSTRETGPHVPLEARQS